MVNPSPQTLTIFLLEILGDTTQSCHFPNLIREFTFSFPPPMLPLARLSTQLPPSPCSSPPLLTSLQSSLHSPATSLLPPSDPMVTFEPGPVQSLTVNVQIEDQVDDQAGDNEDQIDDQEEDNDAVDDQPEDLKVDFDVTKQNNSIETYDRLFASLSAASEHPQHLSHEIECTDLSKVENQHDGSVHSNPEGTVPTYHPSSQAQCSEEGMSYSLTTTVPHGLGRRPAA